MFKSSRMMSKWLNTSFRLLLKKIAKYVENIYEDVLKVMSNSCISENDQVNRECMMINIKLIDLFQDLYEQPDDLPDRE